MNASLLAIIKNITAQEGEAVLADPPRLKALFKQYARSEPKDQCLAFGRCIEQGCYQEFKKTRSAAERQKLKPWFAQNVQSITGLDSTLCADALDLLEAVMFGTPAPARFTPPPVQPVYQPPPQYQQSGAGGKKPADKKAPVIIALAAAALLAAAVVIAVFSFNNRPADKPVYTLLGTWKYIGIDQQSAGLELLSLLLQSEGMDPNLTAGALSLALTAAKYTISFTGSQMTHEISLPLAAGDYRFTNSYYIKNGKITLPLDDELILEDLEFRLEGNYLIFLGLTFGRVK